jgi:Flp pilus assembly protein TadG
MRRFLIRQRGERGQALVEFALIVPIFILMLLGLFDIGRAVYDFNTISNASREAVRVAIVDQDCTFIENQAINRAVSLGLAPVQVDIYIWDPEAADSGDFTSASAIANHRQPCGVPTPANAPNTCRQSNTEATIIVGCVVEVTIHYQYTPATPIIGNLIGTIDMTATTREPIEHRCDSDFLTPPDTCQVTTT